MEQQSQHRQNAEKPLEAVKDNDEALETYRNAYKAFGRIAGLGKNPKPGKIDADIIARQGPTRAALITIGMVEIKPQAMRKGLPLANTYAAAVSYANHALAHYAAGSGEDLPAETLAAAGKLDPLAGPALAKFRLGMNQLNIKERA